MGKFVILPSHPSNDFFAQFPNCLAYTTKEEFVGELYYALTHEPEPMVGEYAHALTWAAATERLFAAASIPVREAELMERAQIDEAGFEVGSADLVSLPVVDLLLTLYPCTKITLPSLMEEEQSQRLAETLRVTRERYRQLRSRLSNEIQQNKCK